MTEKHIPGDGQPDIAREPYNDQERAELITVIRFINDHISGHRYPTDVAVSLIKISEAYGRLHLPEIEAMFRETDSPVYLSAIPLTGNYKLHLVSTLPDDPVREYPYYLHISVFGQEEHRKILEEIGQTPEENYALLEQTGILHPRKGIHFNRMLHAADN